MSKLPARAPRASPPKTTNCRQLRVECPTCGYLARVTRKWLAQGAPICPLDGAQLVETVAKLNPAQRQRRDDRQRAARYAGPATSITVGLAVRCPGGGVGVVTQIGLGPCATLVTFGADGPVYGFDWQHLTPLTRAEADAGGLEGVRCDTLSF